MEVRETYYEVYFDGQHQYEGSYEDCRDIAINALDDDLAEVYKVTITEEKVVL
jgi:mRNA-degrading endonuclease YafQ of YafQ-DinJ toxin-antitoxin module